MSNKYSTLSGDIEVLEKHMKTSRKKEDFRRFQAIYLRISKGLSVEEIAEVTCYSKSWVRQLHSLYKNKGLDVLTAEERGGRNRENMTLEEEYEFLVPFLLNRNSDGTLNVDEIHRSYEKKIDRKVSLSVIYLLLHRHGWRKIPSKWKYAKRNLVTNSS